MRPRVALQYPERIYGHKIPPDWVQGFKEFEVDRILKRRLKTYGRGTRVEYLVHWKGYPPEDDTWEPLENLGNASESIADFNLEHPTHATTIHVVSTNLLSSLTF
jgi:hypothetical protein